MQAVISTWFNLEKTIFKPKNETIYGTNDHFMFKICRVHCPRNDQTPPLKKATGSTSRNKQRRAKRGQDFVQ